jgi:hypothetical protein
MHPFQTFPPSSRNGVRLKAGKTRLINPVQGIETVLKAGVLGLERQHGVPLLLPSSSGGAEPLKLVAQQGGGDAVSEAYIQALIHEHPACLPIAKIDPMFSGPVPICTELSTPAGPIDNFMVTPSGLPVLVECKLWRNPEARREVVSQILDYAKELSRWFSPDVQREVSHRLKRDGNVLLDMVRAVNLEVDEQQLNDALTANLFERHSLQVVVRQRPQRKEFWPDRACLAPQLAARRPGRSASIQPGDQWSQELAQNRRPFGVLGAARRMAEVAVELEIARLDAGRGQGLDDIRRDLWWK